MTVMSTFHNMSDLLLSLNGHE